MFKMKGSAKNKMTHKPAPTKKISNWIEDRGLTIELSDGTMLCARYVDSQLWLKIDPETGVEIPELHEAHYTITSHSGYMPAFHTAHYATLQELADAMKSHADLRSWSTIQS
jgi:hypothetical protein